MVTESLFPCPWPGLTAGEDERAGVLVHGEVVELELTLSIDGQPVKHSEPVTDFERLKPSVKVTFIIQMKKKETQNGLF